VYAAECDAVPDRPTCEANATCLWNVFSICDGDTSCWDLKDQQTCSQLNCLWMPVVDPITCAGACRPPSKCRNSSIEIESCVPKACGWVATKQECVSSPLGCFWASGILTFCGTGRLIGGECSSCSEPIRSVFAIHNGETCTWPAGGSYPQEVSVSFSDYAHGSSCPPNQQDDLPNLTAALVRSFGANFTGPVVCVRPDHIDGSWSAGAIVAVVLLPLLIVVVATAVCYWRRRANHLKNSAIVNLDSATYQPPRAV